MLVSLLIAFYLSGNMFSCIEWFVEYVRDCKRTSTVCFKIPMEMVPDVGHSFVYDFKNLFLHHL